LVGSLRGGQREAGGKGWGGKEGSGKIRRGGVIGGPPEFLWVQRQVMSSADRGSQKYEDSTRRCQPNILVIPGFPLRMGSGAGIFVKKIKGRTGRVQSAVWVCQDTTGKKIQKKSPKGPRICATLAMMG